MMEEQEIIRMAPENGTRGLYEVEITYLDKSLNKRALVLEKFAVVAADAIAEAADDVRNRSDCRTVIGAKAERRARRAG